MSRGRPSVLPAFLIAFVSVLAASGCGAHLFVPPDGPGVPAPEASAVWARLTADCRSVDSLVAAMQVSGRGLPSLSITGAVTRAGEVMLDARAAGTQQFRLSGTASAAMIWLRDGNRVARGPAAAIVEALVGARLGPDRLLAILSGCLATDLSVTQAARYGDRLAIVTPDTRVFLRETDNVWRVEAAEFDGVIAQYDAFDAGWPTAIVMRSAPGEPAEFRLTVRVTNWRQGLVAPAVFAPPVPAGAVEVGLEELGF